MKYGIVLFFISILLSVVLLNPKVKALTVGWLMDSHKQVLSQLEMDLDGTLYKVVKVQNSKGLAVELYRIQEGELTFLDSQQLTDKQDAFYKFENEKHNLFLKDINSDGVEEVILPSLDKNMKARLNVFSFDRINEVLKKETAH